MGKIAVKDITDRQKLIIRNGLNTYLYIQSHCNKPDDEDFQEVYHDFYMRASKGRFRKENTKKRYFELLKEQLKKPKELKEIVEELQKYTNCYEFSFATKLLHTANPKLPIYDSKVHDYLTKVLGKRFPIDSSSKKTSKLERIIKTWEELQKWYNEILPISNEWVEWFNANFPEGNEISNVKKIDFIIFACAD